MGYTGISYKIKQGDTLWNLAATHLGSPTEWPRLYEFNNRNEVVRAGARRIIDPDRIYAGSTLRLPILQSPGTPVASMPLPSANVPHPGRLRDKLPSISMPYSSAVSTKASIQALKYQISPRLTTGPHLKANKYHPGIFLPGRVVGTTPHPRLDSPRKRVPWPPSRLVTQKAVNTAADIKGHPALFHDHGPHGNPDHPIPGDRLLSPRKNGSITPNLPKAPTWALWN